MKKSKWSNLRVSKRFGGGGGNPTPSTTENIPSWMRPYIEQSLGAATGAYSSGALSQVAGDNATQEQAFGMGDDIAQAGAAAASTLDDQQARLLAKAQSGGFDPAALKQAAITEAGQATAQLGQQYGQSGTLGSARQAVAQSAQDAATAAKFADIDKNNAQQQFQNQMTAEGALGQSATTAAQLPTQTASSLAQLGAQERGVDQQKLDSTWQGIQRLSSAVYGAPVRQTANAQQGGK
jgi:tartrate dehydratase beta subunit/fumarate hydratase class I family protein